jgi:hypothetical protein
VQVRVVRGLERRREVQLQWMHYAFVGRVLELVEQQGDFHELGEA